MAIEEKRQYNHQLRIDEAIEILTVLSLYTLTKYHAHSFEALGLGIEALKEVERLRSYKAFHIVKLLPGETKE